MLLERRIAFFAITAILMVAGWQLAVTDVLGFASEPLALCLIVGAFVSGYRGVYGH